jgi:DNA polymerase I-like protein with 3'-5' exonuclease and polymerase domains
VIKGTPYRMIFPVHDQLIIEAPRDSLDRALVQSVCKAMVDAGSASKVPMVVEGSVCYDNWAEQEKLPGYGWCGVTGAAL